MPQKRPVLLLEMVLLPGTQAVLRLMDKAGKNLAQACYEAKKPFGILYCKEDGEAITGDCATVGCFAHVDSINTNQDGAVVAQITGGQRFKVVALNPLGEGRYEVSYTLLHDKRESAPLDEDLFEALLNMLSMYLETLEMIDDELVQPLPENLSEFDLTFLVLEYMSIAEEVRQQGLEIVDLRVRAQFCVKLLKQEIARLNFLIEGLQEEDESDFDPPPYPERMH